MPGRLSHSVYHIVIFPSLAIPCLPWINTRPRCRPLDVLLSSHQGKLELRNLSVSFPSWMMIPKNLQKRTRYFEKWAHSNCPQSRPAGNNHMKATPPPSSFFPVHHPDSIEVRNRDATSKRPTYTETRHETTSHQQLNGKMPCSDSNSRPPSPKPAPAPPPNSPRDGGTKVITALHDTEGSVKDAGVASLSDFGLYRRER